LNSIYLRVSRVLTNNSQARKLNRRIYLPRILLVWVSRRRKLLGEVIHPTAPAGARRAVVKGQRRRNEPRW